MKRLIKRFSFLAIALATALLIIGLSIPINSNKPAVAFEYFPFNKPQAINFQAKADSLIKLTERQKKDQFLDWLLFTVESDRSFSTKEISEASYDISPVRYDYLKPVSNFEYGDTRSLYVGKETIVALIPQESSPEQRIDYLAHIADKHRQNLGRIPEKLEVFEYQLDLETDTAQLTRTEELKTNSLFDDKKYGYHQTYIKNLSDLNQFMAKVDDITFAQVIDSDLLLGGRKIKSHSYGKISVEDVAALWQSEKQIETQPHVFQVNGSGFSLDPGYDYQGLQESLTKIKPRLIALKSNDKSLFSNKEIELVEKGLSENDEIPYLQLIDKFKQNEENIFKSSLSKIDSQINARIELAKKELDQKINDYQNHLQLELNLAAAYLRKSNYTAKEKQQKYKQKVTEFDLKFEKFKQDLIDKKIQEIKNFEAQSNVVFSDISRFLETPKTKSFQTARYDGDLQGTEVGMVLYYTDLLAKLWVLDYLGTTPEKYIADFQPLTKISTNISSIYEQELKKLPSTRVWFGHQDKGFQKANDGNSLLFARNTTRIFAASSNPLEPGKETIARTDSDAFLGWWDEHYEEIARYEPQYERLNEIMKWSLVISWLNESERGELLGFLQGVQVNHDNWFPDWVQANIKQLKFKEWDTTTCSEDFYNSSEQPKVCFYPRGYKDTTTEAMPRLRSESFRQFGESKILSGGVSLANPKIISNRTPLPTVNKISDTSWRGNIDYRSINLNNQILSFKTFDGATYNLKVNQSFASIIAKAQDGAKLRNLDSELVNIELARQISRTNNGITINAVAGDTNIGNFNSSRTGNAFTVGWRSRDIDMGQSLALELSLSKSDPVKFLGSHPRVNSLVTQQDGLAYYVKIDDSKQWLKLGSKDDLFAQPLATGSGGNGGNGGNGNIPPGWTSQVASSDDSGSSKYLLAWIDETDVNKQINQGKAKQVGGPPPIDPPNGNKQFFDDLENGQYEEVATSILDDPIAFIKRKKVHFETKLEEIDGLMKRENYTRAAQVIDDSLNIYGKQAELMMYKALVNMKLQRLKVEGVSIEGLKTPNNANFFDEVNGILENSDKGKFKSIRKDDAFMYVQDTPKLYNIDWSNPIENSIPSMSAKTRVYKLQDGDIGNIKLEDLGFNGIPPINNENLPLSSANPNSSSSNQFYRGNFSRGLRKTGSDNKCQDIKEDQIKQVECNLKENNVYVMYVPD